MRQDPAVFAAYWRSLCRLDSPPNCELTYAFVNDDDKLELPSGCTILSPPERPVAAAYAVDSITHRWAVETFEHLAKCKQLLLNHASEHKFDYIFLVDSDILLEPSTLRSLFAAQVDICNGLFWTSWTPQDQPMPQCWLSHPYGMDGLGMHGHEYMQALRRHELVRVAGGGACTLIKTSVLDKIGYHPRLQLPLEGMWQGEDRSFAIHAQRAHVRQYVDAWPRIHHCYHPSQRTGEAMDKAWADLCAPQQLFAKIGDWINFVLTPMEDAPLQQHIDPRARACRGRLGAIKLAPELEEALLSMQVGDRQIVDYLVQSGNPVYPPGSHKAVMLELVDARP